jgi:hypothetical protein
MRTTTVRFWLVLAALLAASAVLAMFAPEEAKLGPAIRIIYVHVSLTWVGMLALMAAGVLGVIVLVGNNGRLQTLMKIIGWVGFGFYAAGVGFSMIASDMSWGSVFLQEPRMAAALNMVATGLIVMLAITFLSPSRFTGVLPPAYAILLLISTFGAELVLHPRNPIATSSSSAIQFTFLGMTAIYGLTAVWIIHHWHKQAQQPTNQAE